MEEVKYYMEESILSIDETASVIDAAVMMRGHKVAVLFVSCGEKFVGVITEGDLTRKVIVGDMYLRDTEVRAVMSRPIVSIESDFKTVDAFFHMRKKRYCDIAVSEGKKWSASCRSRTSPTTISTDTNPASSNNRGDLFYHL